MLELRMQTVGPWPMNAYALVSAETGASVLIDPGADVDQLLELLAGTQPQAIWITHAHEDHIAALAEARAALSVPVWAYGSPALAAIGVVPDRLLRDGDRLALGDDWVRVDFTPGHTDDAVCFLVVGQPIALVGDSVFPGGPGSTETAAEFRETLRTLQDVVLAWPDDTVGYPGHGEAFRLGDIRPQVEAFLARDHGDFHGDATWDMAA